MERVLEPQLMDEDEQARAYAEADFEAPHSNFIALFRALLPACEPDGFVLDLGCGPADITLRFARAFPDCIVHGVDGAAAMLRYGERRLAAAPDARRRITLVHGLLPAAPLPRERYDVVISNSLLHHLPQPQVLWQTVRRYGAPGAAVFIMDLRRPPSVEEAQRLADLYSSGEPEVLRRDFYNSLRAAFEPAEIEEQLRQAGLSRFAIHVPTDRHIVVYGQMDS